MAMLPITDLWQALGTHMTANMTRSTNLNPRAGTDVETLYLNMKGFENFGVRKVPIFYSKFTNLTTINYRNNI